MPRSVPDARGSQMNKTLSLPCRKLNSLLAAQHSRHKCWLGLPQTLIPTEKSLSSVLQGLWILHMSVAFPPPPPPTQHLFSVPVGLLGFPACLPIPQGRGSALQLL